MSKQFSRTLFVILALAAAPLGAQNFGEITGSVADSSGAVITGAAVTVTSAATNQVRRAATNETGNLLRAVPGSGTLRRSRGDLRLQDLARARDVDYRSAPSLASTFSLEVGEVEPAGGGGRRRAVCSTPRRRARHRDREQADRRTAAQRPQLPAAGHAEPERDHRRRRWRSQRLTGRRAQPDLPSRSPASAWSSIATRSMAWKTPIQISTPISSSPRWTRSRSSRCRPASTPPSSASERRRST